MTAVKGKLKEENGRRILIQRILERKYIQPGQVWVSSSGNEVTISRVEWFDDDLWVYYRPKGEDEGRELDKESFSFQCRYCLDVDGPRVPAEIQAEAVLLPTVVFRKVDGGMVWETTPEAGPKK